MSTHIRAIFLTATQLLAMVLGASAVIWVFENFTKNQIALGFMCAGIAFLIGIIYRINLGQVQYEAEISKNIQSLNAINQSKE